MTFIRFRTFEADGVTPIGSRTAGSIFCVPTARHAELAGLVLPVPFQLVLDGLPKTVNLMPTALNWIWSFREDVAGVGVTRYCTVSDSLLTIDYEDLVDVDPTTLDPAAVPEPAWWAALGAGVASADADVTAAAASATAASGSAVAAAGSASAAATTLSSKATSLAVATTVTASGAAVANKHNPVDATSGNLVITLPTGQPAGTTLVVEKSDSTVNTVTASGSIRGAALTLVLSLAKESMGFLADSAGSWWPIAGHKTLGSLQGVFVGKDTVTVNVKDHGATGNGTTDDTAALNAARDFSTVGSKIVLPKGTYLINGITLNKPGQVWELLEGAILLLKAASVNNVILISAANVKFSGGSIDGNKSNQTAEKSGIAINAANVTVQGVEVSNCYGNGIALVSGAVGCLVQGNYSHDNGLSTNAGNGIYLTGATYCRVIGNRCENNGTVGNGALYDGNGIYITGGSYNLVANNQSNFNARRGVKVQELAPTITGNNCTGNSGSGIGVTNTPNPLNTPGTITGNSLVGNTIGMQLDNCSFLTITGNVISDSANYGVSANAGASWINFTGNTIARSGAIGLNLLAIWDWNISGNTAVDNGQLLVTGARTGFNFADYNGLTLGSAAIANTTGIVAVSAPVTFVVNDPVQFNGLTGAAGMFTDTTYFVRSVIDSTHFTVSQSLGTGILKAPTTDGTAPAYFKALYCQRVNVVGNTSQNSGAGTVQDRGFTLSGRGTFINLVGNLSITGIVVDYSFGPSITQIARTANVGISLLGSGTSSYTSFYMAPGSYIGGSTVTGLTIMNDPTYKLAFWAKTPVVQPAAPPADATDLATAIALVNDLKAKLRTIGLLA